MAEATSRPWLAWAGGAMGLLVTVGSGFYGAAEWITRTTQATKHNTEALGTLNRSIEALNGQLATVNQRASEETHRTDSEIDAVGDKILDLQRQLTEMERAYSNVTRLEERYDRAFATYQPQPRRKRR